MATTSEKGESKEKMALQDVVETLFRIMRCRKLNSRRTVPKKRRCKGRIENMDDGIT